MENKKPWFSKTILTNLVVAVAAFFKPSVVEQLSASNVLMILSSINLGLRLVTKDKIQLGK